MIRIDRTVVTAPTDLTDKEGIGQVELAEVVAWIQAGRGAERPKFRAYKVASVGLALEKLFAGKCAYCESRYTKTQPVDVEHWRPKAEVEGDDGKALPGYEWLAANWTNLLPSCIDCNRQRNQTVIRWKNNALAEERKKQGKGNQFPLIDETKRVNSPVGDLALESPLLLNPCFDDPAEFLRFRDDGVVVPKVNEPKTAQEKDAQARALKSIEVYALNRKALVDERKERLLLLRSRFDLILELVRLENRMEKHVQSNPALTEPYAWLQIVKDLREREIAVLEAWTKPQQPYALMASQFVVEFLSNLQR